MAGGKSFPFSVKIWELVSDNFIVSPDESSINEMLDPLRAIEILFMHICSTTHSLVCFLHPASLALASIFVFPILPDQLQEKLSYRKIISPL